MVYTSSGTPVWYSHTAGTGSGNYLTMQTDGTAVDYTSAGKALWGADRLTPDKRAGQRGTV